MDEKPGMTKVLIVGEDRPTSGDLASTLAALGYSVCGQSTCKEPIREIMEERTPDLVMIDTRLQGKADGLDIVNENEMGMAPVLWFDVAGEAKNPVRIGSTIPILNLKTPIDKTHLKLYLDMAFHLSEINTELQVTKRELAVTRDRYRSLFSATLDGICIHEIVYNNGIAVDYVVLDVNDKYVEITGISKEVAIGSPASKVYWADEPPYLEIYAKVVETGKPYTFDTYFEPMGKYFSISVFSIGSHKFATVFQDITPRKKTELALKESENKFRLTYYTTPDSVNINRMDDGLYVDVNEGFTNITGYSREDAIGKTSIELGIWYDEHDRKTLINELREFGYCHILEAKFRKKNGDIITGRMSARIITLKGIPHIISITRDVSKFKEIELQREQLISELQTALNEVKTLQGFIPICANCKKIRDDEGFWEQIEKYVSDRTDAQFSHGICPDCIKELYPEFSKS